MNDLWYADFESIIAQMQAVAGKIRTTVEQMDVATKKLVCDKEFDYYDETTTICDGVPITPEPITIDLKESTSFGEDTIEDATTTNDGKKLYQFQLAMWYTFNAMDSPKLPDDEIAQFWVVVRIGMNKQTLYKEVEFDFETASVYLDHLLNTRYPETPEWKRSNYTVDDFKAVIADLFDQKSNVDAFNEWIDTIMKIVDAFELPVDGGDQNG